MKGLFDAYRDADLTLEELARAGAQIAKKLELRSDDRRVGPLNERTIRYYQGRGLLDPPVRSGRRVRYSLLHLLQVLAVRRLQVEGCTLDGIEKLIRSGDLPWRSAPALERGLSLTSQTLATDEPSESSGLAFLQDPAPTTPPSAPTRQPPVVAAAARASPPVHASRDDLQAMTEDALYRMERRLEEIADRQVRLGLERLMPRLEAMLDTLLHERLGEGRVEQISRDVGPGVRVLVDPSRVKDPHEVISRIERAVSDDV